MVALAAAFLLLVLPLLWWATVRGWWAHSAKRRRVWLAVLGVLALTAPWHGGDFELLKRAKLLAAEAVDKLYVHQLGGTRVDLFRGHPAKSTYQANDGVGLLLHALLELDALPERWRPAF